MISRSDGYRRGQGKEEGGLRAAETLFEDRLKVPLQRITDPEVNYRLGDFRSKTGQTIECKRQPIDPLRFKDNFVEVCEETRNARHAAGFSELAQVLELDESRLAGVRVRVRGRTRLFGRPGLLSVSVRSIVGSALTVYVNPRIPAHIYVYESAALVDAIKRVMLDRGMVRGVGHSNEDTFAVFLPPPPARWSAIPGQPWRYSGQGMEEEATTVIHRLLGRGG